MRPKWRLRWISLLLLLCLFLSACPARASVDYAAYDYVALTDVRGEEYVYDTAAPEFADAVAACMTAYPQELPTWIGEDTPSLLLEWIRDDRARQYTLYLSPAHLSVYMQDDAGRGYRFADAAVPFFFSLPAATPSLIGEEPPALYVGETSVSFALCQWTYQGLLGDDWYTVSTEEYWHTPVEAFAITPADFAPRFDQEPAESTYTLYAGTAEIASSCAVPDLANLAPGRYQLVLVAVWEEGYTRLRAGYSFAFSI